MSTRDRDAAEQDRNARIRATASSDECLLIEAGAGTGKTTLLARRIAMLLARGVAAETIVTVTFTHKAAEELAQRVEDVAQALAHADEIDTQARATLHTALQSLDSMVCTTLHGLCLKIIETLDPRAHQVIEPQRAERERDRHLRLWIRRRLEGERDAGAELLATLMTEAPQASRTLMDTVGAQAPGPIDQGLKDFDEALRSYESAVHAWTHALGQESGANGLRDLDAKRTAPRIVLGRARAARARNVEGVYRFLAHSAPESITTRAGAWRKLNGKTALRAEAKRRGCSTAEANAQWLRLEACHKTLGSTWTALREAAAETARSAIGTLAWEARRAWCEHKTTHALYELDDLIATALETLEQSHEARARLAKRWHHILIDELQDTDPAQMRIAQLIAQDETGRLRPGALVCVGDPKQAIYGFRGADIATYMQAKTGGDFSPITITRSFRSRPEIGDWVNERFAPLLAEHAGQPGFTAMECTRGAGTQGAGVHILQLPEGDGRRNADEARALEAAHVAALCKRWLREATPGAARPCDIALLTPQSTGLWHYEHALAEHQIPFRSHGGKGFWKTEEIQDCVVLMRCIADPSDAIAYAALLRGPLVAMTDTVLVDIAHALGQGETPARLVQRIDATVDPERLAPWPPVRYAVEVLARLAAQRDRSPPHALLSQALDALGVRALHARRSGHTDQIHANVDKMLTMAAQAAMEGTRAFARAIDHAWRRGLRESEAPCDEANDHITLTTMHSAKGLEWPTVIVVNTATRASTKASSVLATQGEQATFRVRGVAPPSYEAAARREREAVDAERIRLWYVTATRARERLVLIQDPKAPKGAWQTLIE